MSRPGSLRTTLAGIGAAALVAGLVTTAPASASDARATGSETGSETGSASLPDGRYVVVLRAPAASSYAGGPEAPGPTGGPRVGDDARRAYSLTLEAAHEDLASDVGAEVVADYTVTLNGFTADLTGDQARTLLRDRRVLTVSPVERLAVDTWASPELLGLTGRRGSWARHGGVREAGAGVVVGVIDSGIWPEARSFAGRRLTPTPQTRWRVARRGEQTSMRKADGSWFRGRCQAGERFAVTDCTGKLIGARFYDDSWDGGPGATKSPQELDSPRDVDGHGTHVTATAAGNARVPAVRDGRRFGLVSGMAPAAKVAVYKACWAEEGTEVASCWTDDVLAAVEDAVADGVDVLNYSVETGDTSLDPVTLAFRGAAEAGVFVTTSAGNAGPAPGTVENPAPWVTSVAATTHTDAFEGTLVLGNGTRVLGRTLASQRVGPRRLVDAGDVAADGVAVEEARLCAPDSLDPDAVAGAIVVCTRGGYGRLVKGAEVDRARGAAMVLVNAAPGESLDADDHVLPGLQVPFAAADALQGYLDRAGSRAVATLRPGNRTARRTPVPQVTPWSSRGPSAEVPDLLKPDLSAPGEYVLAAVSPVLGGRRFDLLSGTSMAAPHVAGLAAFLASDRPGWTPMQLKSAMMTTATSNLDDRGRRIRDAFAQGAGQVSSRRMFDPGLFVTSGPREWRRLLAWLGRDTGADPLAARELNQPALLDGRVLGSTSFERVLTAARAGRWRVSVDVPGFRARVDQRRIATSRPGERERLRVRFTRTTAPYGRYAQGFLRLTGPTTVRIPVALRPLSVTAPEEVRGTGTTGTTDLELTAGLTGSLPVAVHGLVRPVTSRGTVDAQATPYLDRCVEVAEGTRLLRADLDADDPGADIDLTVFAMPDGCDGDLGEQVDRAAGPTGDETVTWSAPEAGSYLFSVEYYRGPDDAADFTLDLYRVTEGGGEGDLRVVPDPLQVLAGRRVTARVAWEGLLPDARYLGLLEYDGALSGTVVAVDTSRTAPDS